MTRDARRITRSLRRLYMPAVRRPALDAAQRAELAALAGVARERLDADDLPGAWLALTGKAGLKDGG